MGWWRGEERGLRKGAERGYRQGEVTPIDSVLTPATAVKNFDPEFGP